MEDVVFYLNPHLIIREDMTRGDTSNIYILNLNNKKIYKADCKTHKIIKSITKNGISFGNIKEKFLEKDEIDTDFLLGTLNFLWESEVLYV